MATIGRVNVNVSLLKRGVAQSKDEIRGEIRNFLGFLNEARRQFVSLTHVTQANARKECDGMAIEIETQKRLLHEKEIKISKQKQKIIALKQQLEASRGIRPNSTRVMQLEEELAEKQSEIEELTKITQDRTFSRTEDIALTRQVKDLKFKIIQLESKLEERDHTIEQMKLERVRAIRTNEQLQKSQRETEELKKTKARAAQLEDALAEKEKQISQLKALVMKDNEQSALLTELEEGHEKLIAELELRNQMVEEGKQTAKELHMKIKELEGTIRNQGNELAVMRAEANSLKETKRDDVTQQPQEDEQELSYKEVSKIKRKVLEMQAELEQLESDKGRNEGIIEALNANVTAAESRTAKVAAEKKALEMQLERKARTVEDLRAKVKKQEEGFKQKEELLEQLLERDAAKSDEIGRLMARIDSLTSSNQRRDEGETKQEEFSQLSSSLTDARSKVSELNLQVQECNHTIWSQKKTIEEQADKIAQLEEDLSKMQDVKTGERMKLESQQTKNDILIDSLKGRIADLEKQLVETQSQQRYYSDRHSEAIKMVSNRVSEFEDLRADNSDLKEEIVRLQTQIQQEYIPLKRENEKMKAQLDGITGEKTKLRQELSMMEADMSEVKSDIVSSNLRLSDTIKENEDLRRKCDKNKRRVTENKQILSTVCDILHADTPESLTQRVKSVMAEQQRLCNELNQKEAEIKALKHEMKDRDKALLRANDSREKLKKMEADLIEQKRVNRGVIDKLDKSMEVTNRENDALKEGIDSIRRVIDFRDLSELVEKLKIILERDRHLQEMQEHHEKQAMISREPDPQILELESKLMKEKKETEHLQQTIELMKETIINHQETISKLRDKLSEQEHTSHSLISEEKEKSHQVQEQLEHMQSAINRLHGILQFASVDDLYPVLFGVLERNRQAISDLKFDNDVIRKQIEAKDKELESAETRNADLKKELKEVREQRKPTSEPVKELDSEKEEPDTISSKILTELLDVATEKEVLPAITSLKSQAERKDNKIAKLHGEIEELKQTIKDKEAEAERNLANERDTLSRFVTEQNEFLGNLGVLSLSKAAEKFQSLTKRIKALTTRSSDLEDEKDQYMDMVTKRESAIQSIAGERETMKATVVVEKARTIHLQRTIDELMAENEKLEKSLREMATDHQIFKNKVLGALKCEDVIEGIQALQDQLSDAQQQIARLNLVVQQSEKALQVVFNSLFRKESKLAFPIKDEALQQLIQFVKKFFSDADDDKTGLKSFMVLCREYGYEGDIRCYEKAIEFLKAQLGENSWKLNECFKQSEIARRSTTQLTAIYDEKSKKAHQKWEREKQKVRRLEKDLESLQKAKDELVKLCLGEPADKDIIAAHLSAEQTQKLKLYE